MKLNKKGVNDFPAIIIVIILIVAFLIYALFFSGAFSEKTDETINIQSCRTSLILNAYVRGRMTPRDYVTRGAATRERVAVNCEQRPLLEIKYNDVSESTRNIQGIKFSIMKLISDEMVITHHKTIGDISGAEPFARDDGIYCIIDREITFDDRIRRNEELGVIEDLLTYQINARTSSTSFAGGKYYSEYLYGYRKDDTEGRVYYVDLVERYISEHGVDVPGIDPTTIRNSIMNIETDRDYYIVRVIVKGSTYIDRYLRSDLHYGASIGAGAGVAKICTLLIGALAIPGKNIIAGAGLIACFAGGAIGFHEAGKIFGSEEPFFGQTILIPVDEYYQLGCR